MPDYTLTLTHDQIAALNEAAAAAKLSTGDFTRRAIAVLAARYGVQMPDQKPSVRRVQRVALGPNKGGRPRKSFGEMRNHVPAGDFYRVCPWCGREFRTDNEAGIYCDPDHKVAMENARAYQKRKQRC